MYKYFIIHPILANLNVEHPIIIRYPRLYHILLYSNKYFPIHFNGKESCNISLYLHALCILHYFKNFKISKTFKNFQKKIQKFSKFHEISKLITKNNYYYIIKGLYYLLMLNNTV